MPTDDPSTTPAAAGTELPPRIQDRASNLLAHGGFLAGRPEAFETIGRLQLEVLLHEGLCPSSRVVDVGCGVLRAGYWLMHFLEPGCYMGIEPRRDEVEQGLRFIVEPELVARAQPRFAYNDDFDLTVFGTPVEFVLARSIWTHASKQQIAAMLDSFVTAGAPGAVLLASYLPASRFPEAIRAPLHATLRRVPRLTTVLRRVRGHRLAPADYQGSTWQPGLVGHRRAWIERQCVARGLTVRELDHGRMLSQVWLRIENARVDGRHP